MPGDIFTRKSNPLFIPPKKPIDGELQEKTTKVGQRNENVT